MTMRIVVLESSPHQNGASNTLATFFIRGAQEAGHTVEILDVAHMDLNPCIGCFRGKNVGHCVVRDDMRHIEQALATADLMVWVTPVYFYDMSAQLKIVIDRLHCFYGNLPGKKLLLLATAWREDEEVMAYLEGLYHALADYLGCQDLGAILARGCGSPETICASQYAAQAYQMGKNIE